MTPSALSRVVSLSTVAAIAHRGGAKLRPENTMLAFEHAVSLGVDAIECDVRLSRDGQLVVMHDPTLDRTTDASGPVESRTAAELAAVDAGYRFEQDGGHPYRGLGLGVPRLDDVLRRWPAMPFVIEIKGERPEAAMRLLEVLRDARSEDRVVVGGFSHVVLTAVRRERPGLLTSASREEVRSALRWSTFWLPPRRTGFALLQVPLAMQGKPVINRRLVQAARRAGIPVQAWIVDEVADMQRLMDWGVTGLISDRPDRAVAQARSG